MSSNKPRRCIIFLGPIDLKTKSHPAPVILARCGQTQPPAVLASRCLKKYFAPLHDEYAMGTIIFGYEHDSHIMKPDPSSANAVPWPGTAVAGQFGDFIKAQVEKFFSVSSPLAA